MTLDDPASTWLFVGALAVLSVLMVMAMLPFTLSVVARPHPPRRMPLSLGKARGTLLALNGPGCPFRLTELSDNHLRLDWDVVDASWYELFARVKETIVYRGRLFLHEAGHEVCYHETLRWSNLFIGFQGLRPRFNWAFRYQSGVLRVVWSGLAYGIKEGFPPQIGEVCRVDLDTVWTKRELEAAANRAGWTFRPVIWWFEATPGGVAWIEKLTPPFMRRWSRRWFWGALYVGLWAVIVALLLVTIPPHSEQRLRAHSCHRRLLGRPSPLPRGLVRHWLVEQTSTRAQSPQTLSGMRRWKTLAWRDSRAVRSPSAPRLARPRRRGLLRTGPCFTMWGPDLF